MNSEHSNEVAVPNQSTTTQGENKMEKVLTLIEVNHDARIKDYQLAAYIVNGWKNERYDANFTEVQTEPIGITDIMNKTDEYNERLESNVALSKGNAWQSERLREAYRKHSELVDTMQVFIDKLFNRDYLSEESDLWNLLEELFEDNTLERPFHEVRTLKFDVVTTQRVIVTCKVPKSYDEDELYDLFSKRISTAVEDEGDIEYTDDNETDDVTSINIDFDDPEVEVETAG